MNISEALKEEGIRVSFEDKWLIRESCGRYVVRQKKYRSKTTRVIFMGDHEQRAVEILLKG
jgi:hypothetical protein